MRSAERRRLFFFGFLGHLNNVNNIPMSLASKLTLAASCTISAGIILYVHYKQEYDRYQLHLGVIKDMERTNRRKIENTYLLQQQAELTKQLQRDLTEKNQNNFNSTTLPS